MTDFAEALRRGAASLGLELDAQAVSRLERWRALVREWSPAVGLVADAGDPALLEAHLLDSLAHAALLGEATSLIDVGSGAGLPGLPLAVLRPELRVTLVESAQRKADFLRAAARALELDAVTVVEARAETLGHEPEQRERYDLATARRLAPLAVLFEYLLPLTRVGGRMVVAKGVGLEAELAAADGVPELLGGGPAELVVGPRGRSFVVVAKRWPTPERYPRRVGLPAKRPLRGAAKET